MKSKVKQRIQKVKLKLEMLKKMNCQEEEVC